MSAIDTTKAVLAKASLYDQSFANPDVGILMAWASILGDTDLSPALEAVEIHYARETRRIMPADIGRNITEARRRVAERQRDASTMRQLAEARDAHNPEHSRAGYEAASRAVADALAAKHANGEREEATA